MKYKSVVNRTYNNISHSINSKPPKGRDNIENHQNDQNVPL